MNIEQLIKLIDAGYTKADIEAMAKGTPASDEEETKAPASDEEETKAPASDEEETKAPASDEENTSNSEANKQFATLSQELENIKKLVQGINIKTKGSDEKPNKETASDMLAKIIDPRLNGGN